VNGNSFIKEIGRSYIVSSFTPAAFFIYIGIILFRNFVPHILLTELRETRSLFGSQWLITLLSVFWVAFGLYSSVDTIVKLFEGYYLPDFLKMWMLKGQLKRHQKKSEIYPEVKKFIDKKPNKKRRKALQQLRDYALSELQDLEINEPIDEGFLLPTRLGNILRASERYPLERYKLEGITIWPRLFHVLPPQFIRDLEEKNNHYVFLLNSSLLSFVIGISSLGAAIYRITTISLLEHINSPSIFWMLNYFSNEYPTISSYTYIIIGLLLISVGYALYRIAANAAVDYGLFIRAAFDLYRFDLLEKLKQPLPSTTEEEKGVWEDISEFFIANNRLRFNEFNFVYYHNEKSDKTNNSYEK
jgi:hypothetical protein